MDELLTDSEKAEYLQNLLVSHATGEMADNNEYYALRNYFIDSAEYSELIPPFIRTNRSLNQFWGFIKPKYGTYQQRRSFIWDSFTPLMNHLEGRNKKPADDNITNSLKNFDSEGVHAVWKKALERRNSDPEGAITAARTLIETVCKHILDDAEVAYSAGVDLPELYRLTSKELKLAPSDHTEDTFKKILGGVTSIVTELGSLRNRISDAHGQGKRPVKPAVRHADLAVNLSGSIALFLVETHAARKHEKTT